MYSKSLFILSFLLFFLPHTITAGGTTYYAKLIAQVSSTSTGMGKVYASSSNSGSKTNAAETSSATDDNGNNSFTFYAFAYPNDGYEFVGWSNTATGNVVSTDNPYSVSITATSETSNSPTEATVYAQFTKTVSGAFTVTYHPSDGGTYTVTSESTKTSVADESYATEQSELLSVTLTATPNTGNKFVAWYTLTGTTKTYLSTQATYAATFSESAEVYAEFVAEEIPVFSIQGDGTLYYNLQDALSAIGSATTVIDVVSGGTVAAGTYTIPSNVTLLVPYDDDFTLSTSTPQQLSSRTTASLFRKLTLASDVRLDVEGSICVNAQQGFSQPYAGVVSGNYGQLELEEGSQITLESGAYLYAWGYVTGAGVIDALSGSKTYESLQITGWRGGSCVSSMRGNSQKVFPINQFYVQNIEARMNVHSGAENHARSHVVASSKLIDTGDMTYIGKSSGMFLLSDGYISRWYDADTDRQMYELHGTLSIGSISLTIAYLVTYTVSSEDYVLPLMNNMDVTLCAGSVMTCNKKVALLPGAGLTIEEGAKLQISSDGYIIVYDKDQWGGYTWKSGSDYLSPLPYTPEKGKNVTSIRTFNNMKDATVDVQGTLTADGGFYTTESGANVCCTKGSGTVTFTNGASTAVTTTYQVIQSGTEATYVEIVVTSAQLQNGDGTYTATTEAAKGKTYQYNTLTQIWGDTYTLGEVKEDGEVNKQDVEGIVDIILGNDPDQTKYNHSSADVNQDGKVSVGDIPQLLQKILTSK